MIPLLWKDSTSPSYIWTHTHVLSVVTAPCALSLNISYSIFHTAVLHHLADIQCPEQLFHPNSTGCDCGHFLQWASVWYCFCYLCHKALHRLKAIWPEGHQWQKGHQSMFYCFPSFHPSQASTGRGRGLTAAGWCSDLLSQAFLKFVSPHYSTIHLGAECGFFCGHERTVERVWHEAGEQRHSGKAAWAQNICFWAGTELAEALEPAILASVSASKYILLIFSLVRLEISISSVWGRWKREHVGHHRNLQQHERKQSTFTEVQRRKSLLLCAWTDAQTAEILITRGLLTWRHREKWWGIMLSGGRWALRTQDGLRGWRDGKPPGGKDMSSCSERILKSDQYSQFYSDCPACLRNPTIIKF